MPQYEGSQKASDVRLTQCTLVSSTGTSVGLLELLQELNVYEDLFSSVMTGNIVLNDSNDLINQLPIIGYEYLLLTFEKPGSNVQFKKTFRVYKMTDRIRVNEQNETYILHFASEELFISESILISKTYTNMTISAMILDISKNYLRVLPAKQKTLIQTSGTHTIHIPGFHPFYAINFLSRYALAPQAKGASCIFYEDRDGYHFNSLEVLSQQSPVQSVKLSPKNIGFERDKNQSDLQISQEGAESVSFPECFDTLRNTYSGMYGATLITVDPLRRRVETISYNGLKQFQNTQHLNKFPYTSSSLNRLGRASVDHPEALKKVMITQSESVQYAQNKQQLQSNRIEQWVIPRIMYLTGIHANRISVSIPGSPSLQVGSTVDVKLPALREQTKGGKQLDTLYSGRYLITALRHKINRKSYACITELSKDSVSTEIPDAPLKDALQQIKKS